MAFQILMTYDLGLLHCNFGAIEYLCFDYSMPLARGVFDHNFGLQLP